MESQKLQERMESGNQQKIRLLKTGKCEEEGETRPHSKNDPRTAELLQLAGGENGGEVSSGPSNRSECPPVQTTFEATLQSQSFPSPGFLRQDALPAVLRSLCLWELGVN